MAFAWWHLLWSVKFLWRPWSSGPTRTGTCARGLIIRKPPASLHLMSRRLEALDVLAESERRWLELADQVHFRAAVGDPVFHAQRPIDAVHNHAPRAVSHQVGGRAHRRCKDPAW